MNADAKILKTITANQIPQHVERSKHHDEAQFTPGKRGPFNMHGSLVTHTHTRYRNGGVTPSREQTPASDKLQPPFTVKHSATQEWKELLYHDKGRFFLTTHT